MSTITTRAGKGSPLTNTELDANFTNLNTDKAEKSVAISAGTGLTGGGDLSASRSLGLAASGVTAGVVGSSTAIPILTIDQYGRVTATSSAALDLSSKANTTGSNASGTWGISISGNAATATSSPFLSSLGNYVWSGASTPQTFGLGVQASFVQSGSGFPSYGSVLTVNTYSGGGGALQLYAPYSPTYGGTGVQVRFGNYDVASGNSWTAWKTLLASDNYTSYAMPAGSSATNSVDVRAPIFYDSNDTGYYCDPNSTSALYRVGSYYLSNLAAVSTDHPYGMYFDSGMSTAYAIFRESGSWVHPYPNLRIAFHTGISIGANPSYGGTNFFTDYDMVTYVMSVNNGSYGGTGNVYVHNSLYAQIMYDANNTSYYCDPASTSNLNAVAAASLTVNGFALTNTNTLNFRITTSGAGATGISGYDSNGTWRYQIYGDGSSYGFLNGNWAGWDLQKAISGQLLLNVGGVQQTALHSGNVGSYAMPAGSSATNSVDVRAPIFYDSNNTGYYVDPNSTSRMALVYANTLRSTAASEDARATGFQINSGADIGECNRSTQYYDDRAANCNGYLPNGNCAGNSSWNPPNGNWWTWGVSGVATGNCGNPWGYDFAGGQSNTLFAVSVSYNYDGYYLAADEIGGSEYRRNYRNCNCGQCINNCYTNCNCNCACDCACQCQCK